MSKVLKLFFLSTTVLGVCCLSLLCSCANNKNKMEETTPKPMRPHGTMYSAYDPDFSWALEIDLEGQTSFIDYDNNVETSCKTSPFTAFSENDKQGLEWHMKTDDSLDLHIRVFEENCFNFGFNNNPLTFQLSNENGVLYRIGGCGSFHNPFGFMQGYQLSTINNEDFRKETKLTEAPQITFSKIKTSNLIEGSFGCRTWRSHFNILNRSMGFIFDIYPNTSCYESPELSHFMERMSGKSYYFSFSDNNNKLTLSDKNDTFVFLKMK